MVARALWSHIREHLAPYAALELEELGKERESLAVQVGGGDARAQVYLDGTRCVVVPFVLYAKSDSGERAYGWLCAAARHFSAGVTVDLGGVAGRAYAVDTPHLADRSQQGGYIYTARFAVEYEEGRATGESSICEEQ